MAVRMTDVAAIGQVDAVLLPLIGERGARGGGDAEGGGGALQIGPALGLGGNDRGQVEADVDALEAKSVVVGTGVVQIHSNVKEVGWPLAGRPPGVEHDPVAVGGAVVVVAHAKNHVPAGTAIGRGVAIVIIPDHALGLIEEEVVEGVPGVRSRQVEEKIQAQVLAQGEL